MRKDRKEVEEESKRKGRNQGEEERKRKEPKEGEEKGRRKDRKEGEEDGKQSARKQQAERPQRPAAPPIFSEKNESSTEISKMRQVVKRVWNNLGQLEAALADAKSMTLTED